MEVWIGGRAAGRPWWSNSESSLSKAETVIMTCAHKGLGGVISAGASSPLAPTALEHRRRPIFSPLSVLQWALFVDGLPQVGLRRKRGPWVQFLPSPIFHERFNEASLPVCRKLRPWPPHQRGWLRLKRGPDTLTRTYDSDR